MTNSSYRFWLEDKQYMVYSDSFTVSFVDMDTMESRYIGKGTNYISKSGIKTEYTGFNDVNGKPIYFGDIVSKTDGWSEDIYLVSSFGGEAFLNRLYDGAWPLDKFVECYVVGNKYEDRLLFEKYLNMTAEKLKGVTNKDQVEEYSLAVEPTTYTRQRGNTYFRQDDSGDNATLSLVFKNNNRYKIGKVNYDVAEESADMMEKILLLEEGKENISEYGLANILYQICNGYYNLIEKHIKEEYKDYIIVTDNPCYTMMFDDKDNNTILKVEFTPYFGEVFKRYKDGLAIMKCNIVRFDESYDKTIYLDNKGIAEAIETINSILDAYKEKGGNV
jgi:yopX protein